MDYAVISKNNIVVNVICWDGVTSWEPPTEHIVVPLLEGGIGWSYVDGAFIAPSTSES
jgi:hypothetical protein